ncbi:GNAT family N-acetyltransferase [Longispora albida]|uniref:GNAT family N-acetyltransferase n=1 Tax=Longispora albida TaxID=203523 RepID=UPI0003600002|nr:GNAT family N-acetyltransferase [Longispora albida]
MELSTDTFTLRPWQPGDAEAVYRACQDPAIQRWTRVPVPYLPEHAEGFVRSASPDMFGIFAPDGELLGSIGVVGHDADARVAEVGYWVTPWARGRGVTTRALMLFSEWAFANLGIQRLLWRAKIGNHASRLVAERAGFVMEAVQRKALIDRDGEPVDGWEGALLPGEVPAEPVTVDGRQTRAFSAEQPVIAGDGVTLRPVEDRDAPRLHEACLDEDILRWTSVPHGYTAEMAASFPARTRRQWIAGEAAVFAICGPDGEWAGNIDLRLDSYGAKTADIGYLISPSARGNGYATAALRAVTAWGFDTLGLERIEWRAHEDNLASRRVAEKAGFTIEGLQRARLPHRGERVNCWLAAILATDPR